MQHKPKQLHIFSAAALKPLTGTESFHEMRFSHKTQHTNQFIHKISPPSIIVTDTVRKSNSVPGPGDYFFLMEKKS